MIEPVRSGPDLVREIRETFPKPNGLAVWWLGQSGYVIKSSQGVLVIDPYLSEHLTQKYANTERPHIRMTRAPIRGGDLDFVCLALASHKHSDHLDPGTIPALLEASVLAGLVAPAALIPHCLTMGLSSDQLIGVDAGDVIDRAGFRVRAIPSAHEQIDRDERGRHLYLGYVIETAGLRLYHSGDSLAYDGLRAQLGAEPFDVLFLPVNGRDSARGVPGNMTAAEAVDLASEVRPRFVVPHHYDMFTFNTIPIEQFEAEARRLPPGVEPRILQCGQRWEITT
jgi:L-ascorbate metabolism protein UlaG (beta-lactamase superfamily)